jgi:hypothetical protein
MKFGNIIFLIPILFAGSPFLRIESFPRNAIAHHGVDIITRTHTTRIHTHITTLTTIPITIIGDSKWLVCPLKGSVKTG